MVIGLKKAHWITERDYPMSKDITYRRGKLSLRSGIGEEDAGRKHTFLEFDSWWCGETGAT
jgi:hypothetical protein